MAIARAKLVVGGLAFVAAAVLLGVAAARSGWVYYVDVDQLVQTRPGAGERFRVHGMAEHVEIGPDRMSATFELKGDTRSVKVRYSGPVPELLKSDGQVLVEGSRDDAGLFIADTVLTKCASKYAPKVEAPPERLP